MRIFTKLMKVPFSHLWSMGHNSVDYVNDPYLQGDTTLVISWLPLRLRAMSILNPPTFWLRKVRVTKLCISMHHYVCFQNTGFPRVGDPPTNQNIGLSLHFPPMFCPKNVYFVIFMQFLAILPKLSTHKPISFGKPWNIWKYFCWHHYFSDNLITYRLHYWV